MYSIFSEFELALRTYQGEDPIEPWYNYILWIEQTFPNGGKEGNLNTLLEKCIQQFKGNEKYNQDARFFEVWMKYVSWIKFEPIEQVVSLSSWTQNQIILIIFSGQLVKKFIRSIQLHVF